MLPVMNVVLAVTSCDFCERRFWPPSAKAASDDPEAKQKNEKKRIHF